MSNGPLVMLVVFVVGFPFALFYATRGFGRPLVDLAQERLASPVLAASLLTTSVDSAPRVALALAVTDDEVYLLSYRSRAPWVGGVVKHAPRDALVTVYRRGWRRVQVALSWPEEMVYLAGWMPACPDTDRVIGLLVASERERQW